MENKAGDPSSDYATLPRSVAIARNGHQRLDSQRIRDLIQIQRSGAKRWTTRALARAPKDCQHHADGEQQRSLGNEGVAGGLCADTRSPQAPGMRSHEACLIVMSTVSNTVRLTWASEIKAGRPAARRSWSTC